MSKVVVVDTREGFSAEMAACLKTLDVEVLQVTDPLQLRQCSRARGELVVALWAECPDRDGVNIPRMVMRAIAASRRFIPVVLYTARREALVGLIEPGMQYPTVIFSAHACSVAGAVQRVVKQMWARRDAEQAFEDWACVNQVSLAGSPGRVSVFSADGNGGFRVLGDPQHPLSAVGSLVEASASSPSVEPAFY